MNLNKIKKFTIHTQDKIKINKVLYETSEHLTNSMLCGFPVVQIRENKIFIKRIKILLKKDRNDRRSKYML